MKIIIRKRLAVWYECPQCGSQEAFMHMSPTKYHRYRVTDCWRCNIDKKIVKARYYHTFASDMYGTAGTCEEACKYYFPTFKTFQATIAERDRKHQEYIASLKRYTVEELSQPTENAPAQLLEDDSDSDDLDDFPF